MKPWIQTISGKAIDVYDPRPSDIELGDIAHALAMQCRFNGHCSRFYSVAEHSVHVARILDQWGEDRETVFAGLMHDAAEAYVGDIVQPVKRELELFDEIEDRFWLAIAERFALPRKLPAVVKDADLAILQAEADHIMANPPPRPWNVPKMPPIEVNLEHEIAWQPARDLFVLVFGGLR